MRLSHFSRRWLELASRNVSLTRRLPKRFGSMPLRVSPGAALTYYRKLEGPSWQELYDFAEHCVHTGDVVWDIGASMGVFAFAAAHVAGPQGRVLALEADTWTVAFLKKSARARQPQAATVEVLCAAAGANVGVQPFQIAARGRSMSHLAGMAGAGEAMVGGVREQHPVVTLTLDWLADHFKLPDVIKLDVEGAELLTLSGAKSVLAEHPALFLEVYEGNADAVTSLLSENGYALFDISQGWGRRRTVDRAVFNTLALPRS